MNQTCAIIVTYNIGNDYYDNFLATYPQADQLIIVDNGSSTETITCLKRLAAQFPDKLEIIYQQENIGLGAAQNIAIKQAINMGFTWILLLDHDSKPEQQMVHKLLTAYENLSQTEANIAILAPEIKDLNVHGDQSVFVTSKDNWTFKREPLGDRASLEVMLAISSGSLIKTELIKQIGEFRADFFIDYIDFEFCLRALSQDYRIFAVKDAILYHKLGAKTIHQVFGLQAITPNYPPERRYTIFRNRVQTWKMYYKQIPAFVLFDLIAAIYSMLLIACFETNKRAKFAAIIKGIWSHKSLDN